MQIIKDISTSKRWENILTASIDKIIIFLTICAVPATIASISRIPMSGLMVSMFLHAIISVALIATTIYRKRLSINFKMNFILIVTSLVAIAGVYNWGLLGNGMLWSILSIIFITLFYGIKVGIYASIIFAIYVSIIGYLYINGILETSVDPVSYLSSVSGWLTAILGSLIPLTSSVLIIGSLYLAAKQALLQLDRQRVEITILAEQDELTGIYNSRVFHSLLEQSIERAKRHNGWVYLVNIDLDNFKSINDNYGHHAGDEVLKFTAKQLLEVTRDEDTICRIGGDEFLMLIESPTKYSNQQLDIIINRIKSAINIPYIYEGTTIEISGSIGYAEYNAEETPNLKDKEDILKLADREMYKDKQRLRAQQMS